MNHFKTLFLSTGAGYVAAYSLNNLWFYSIQEKIFKPIDRHAAQIQEEPDFAASITLFFKGWKYILHDFYGFTDYEAELEKTHEPRMQSYQQDEYINTSGVFGKENDFKIAGEK